LRSRLPGLPALTAPRCTWLASRGISESVVHTILKHCATTGRYYSINKSQRRTGTTHPLRDGSIQTEEKEEIVSEMVAFLGGVIRARLADGKVSTLEHLAAAAKSQN
jgi:hypothetical protein